LNASRLLLPLGLAYGAGAALRAACYRRGLLPRARLDGPVISVGNLSVGGSGKTPLVAWIARRLRDAGLRVAVLSRGYGGSFAGECLVVGDGASLLADAAVAGDEPVMLARALPGVVVAVGPRRDVVGRAVRERFGRSVFVLDDGFQHLRLWRDLDVLCLGGGDASDWPLPAGRLREFAAAAARADVSVRMLEESDPPSGPHVFARRRPGGFADASGAARDAPRRAALVSGIARPERFQADMASLGIEVVAHFRYPDHHAFRASELLGAAREARTQGAEALVTTEKDAVRLPEAELPLPLLVLKLQLELQDEQAFLARLLSVARSAA
jgi:tetraacyldisaccharide 4'-kinase